MEMENYQRRLKSYLKKQNYERLESESGHRRPRRRTKIRFGGGGWRRKKLLRIKISPRLRIFSKVRNFSPKPILARIRDGYVRWILGVARSGKIPGGRFGVGFAGPEIDGFARPVQAKSYEEKIIEHICRTVLAQSQLVAAAEGVDGVGAGVARIVA